MDMDAGEACLQQEDDEGMVQNGTMSSIPRDLHLRRQATDMEGLVVATRR
jgi:hypothetical protein